MTGATGPTIVYLTATPPWPSTNGGRLRSALTLQALATVGPTHLLVAPPGTVSVEPPERVGLASVTIDPVPPPAPPTRLVHRLTAAVLARHPYVIRWERAGGPDRLRDLVVRSGATIVVLEFPFYPTAAAALRSTGARIVADVADDRVAVAWTAIRTAPSLVMRMTTMLDHRALRRSERTLSAADQAWYAAPEDAATAHRREPQLDVRVVPNVVDTERLAEMATVSQPAAPRSAAFLGSFDYLPNLQGAERFVSRIAPLILAIGADPDAHLAIIGRHPPDGLREAAAANRVAVHADVPDAAAALLAYGVLVVPLTTGGGTKLKILEALALGIPVVTTSVGRAGLDLVPEEHLLAGESDEELAQGVRRVWHEPDLAARLGRTGQAAVRARYGFEAVRQAVDAAISGLSEDRSPRQDL